MGFFSCKAEPDIWMRKSGDLWEYVDVYIDDLAFVVRDPKSFVNTMTRKYKYKLKGTGSIFFHLGCDFFRDGDGVLCMDPRKYIDEIVDGYKMMFGEKPNTNMSSPLEKGDHPDLDDTALLNIDGIQRYQSLIGSLQ